jgi:hypothetical protein
MSWRVNVVGADGNTKTILKEEWDEVLSELQFLRQSGRRAWIENSVGEAVDEETGKTKTI